MRLRLILSAAAASLLAAGLLILATGAHKTSADREPKRVELTSSIIERSSRLSDLQAAADELRKHVLSATNSLDQILNLARDPGGIEEAQKRWPEASGLMEKARDSAAAAHPLTRQTLEEAEAGASEYRRLRPVVEDPTELGYLDALNEAFQSMIETQLAYSKMNQTLSNGLGVYNELSSVTDDFLNKERSSFFRSKKEAADWYSLRVEHADITVRMTDFKDQMRVVSGETQYAATATSDAFKKVQMWANRLRK